MCASSEYGPACSERTDLLTFAFDGPYQFDQKKPIFLDAENPTRSLNKAQARNFVRRLIAGLHVAGLQKGDCVLVAVPNNVLYSVIYFGVIGAGGVHCGVNPRSSALELDHILRLVEPKFIITSPDAFATVQQAACDRGYLDHQVYLLNLDNLSPNTESTCLPAPPPEELAFQFKTSIDISQDLFELLCHGESDWIRFSDSMAAKSTLAVMFSTSGTSGLPKAAMLSHNALVAQHLSLISEVPYEVSRLISLPFFHVLAASYLHIFPLRLGQPVFVMSRFQADDFIGLIKRYSITDTYMVPPMVNILNKSSLPLADHLRSIRYIAVGGAPIGAATMKDLEDKLDPSATLTQIWGMTEFGPATLHQYPDREGCDGSIGRPLPGYEMRLLDNLGNEILEDHQSGDAEVLCSGTMTGYKNRVPVQSGAWFPTGDVMARVSGKFFVVGRSKELIKVNGFQVAPAEIESVLLSHPCICDAAVLGVMNEDNTTELVRAYIVCTTKASAGRSQLSGEDVRQFARKQLASYKALNGGVVFVDEIPRTASGKIQRFKLAQMDKFRSSVNHFLRDVYTSRPSSSSPVQSR